MGMIQIRNVPDDLHRALKARAAASGVSLSSYMLDLGRRNANTPTWSEMRERLAKLAPVEPPPGGPTSAEIIRELRGPLTG